MHKGTIIFSKLGLFYKKSLKAIFITFFNFYQVIDFQTLTKKLQKHPKKKQKKRYAVSKKYLPLHRFNKQMIVLQI